MLMKPIILLFAVALSAPVQAAWLTAGGEAGNPADDYFQFEPDGIRHDRHLHLIGVRVNRAQPQVASDGSAYRSFDAVAAIDCQRRTAHYVSVKYFMAPNFNGPGKTREFARKDALPVVCWLTPDGTPVRLIKAACATDRIERTDS